MANVAIFRAGQLPQYLQSVNTPDYASDPDALINPDLSAVSGLALKYWKRSGSSILAQSAAEQAATDASIAAALITANRAVADAVANVSNGEGVQLRAIVAILLDEINALRTWTRDFKAATAAATSLANLQTRVAALPTLADRTLAQAKTAYQTKIASGGAD